MVLVLAVVPHFSRENDKWSWILLDPLHILSADTLFFYKRDSHKNKYEEKAMVRIV